MSIIKALVNMLGTVACKEKCGPSVSVTLLRLADKRNQETKAISLIDDSNNFQYSNVIPGKYRLEVCVHSLLCKFLHLCYVRYMYFCHLFFHIWCWVKICFPVRSLSLFHASECCWTFPLFFPLMKCYYFRSNTTPQIPQPVKIIGAGSRASLILMLVLRMYKELNFFRKVTWSILFPHMM